MLYLAQKYSVLSAQYSTASGRYVRVLNLFKQVPSRLLQPSSSFTVGNLSSEAIQIFKADAFLKVAFRLLKRFELLVRRCHRFVPIFLTFLALRVDYGLGEKAGSVVVDPAFRRNLKSSEPL